MKNVILIGFMGAGKTSIGKKLAALQNRTFLDTDQVIEEREGRSIRDIFAENGEAYFRERETALLGDLLEKEEPMVIAVGGGLPVRKENRDYLRKLGTTVYLQAEVDTLLARLTGDCSRPKIQGGDMREKILSLMEAREDIYKEAAQLSYHTDQKNIEKAAEEIHELIL